VSPSLIPLDSSFPRKKVYVTSPHPMLEDSGMSKRRHSRSSSRKHLLAMLLPGLEIHHSWPMRPPPLDYPSGNLRSSFLRQQGTERRHFGVDPLDAVVAGYRDAGVAIENEVGTADLVEADGG
jgi:hypothetical protein